LKRTLTILLIEDSPDFAALVQQWLSVEANVAFALKWTDSLEAGLNRLKQGGVDVILLDLGLPDSTGLETFTRTKRQAAGTPIILLSADDSKELALKMLAEGAQDYVVKSTCDGEALAKAIQYAVPRSRGRAEESPSDQATALGVIGVKGGVGSTTIACNLASELCRLMKAKTLLADLDLDGGMAGFLTSVDSEHSVLDAASNVDRLDASFLEGLVVHSPGGLDVLPSPNLPGVPQPDPEDLRYVLAMMRTQYRWIILDLGRPSAFSLGLLDKVSQLLLVTNTSVPALYQAKRAIDTLRRAGFEPDRLRPIVNQISKTQEFSGSELARLFGVPVYATFSPAAQELHDACVERRLPGKNSDFGIQMTSFARKMAGLQQPKARSRVSQMFSFSEKLADVDSVA
jgi:Flp pilus assembly CpaE family ATPase